MLSNLERPLLYKDVLKGKILNQKKTKKGIVFTYEFDSRSKIARQYPKALDEDSIEPDYSDPSTKTSDTDDDFEDNPDEQKDPKRHDTYNEDENEYPEQEEFEKEDPDNTNDPDTVPKKFDVNGTKNKGGRKKEASLGDEPETDSPETVPHQDERDDDEDNDNDPDTNPQRIVSEKERVAAHAVRIQTKGRKIDYIDDKRTKVKQNIAIPVSPGRQAEIKRKSRIKFTQNFIIKRCNACHRDFKVPEGECKYTYGVSYRCDRCMGGR